MRHDVTLIPVTRSVGVRATRPTNRGEKMIIQLLTLTAGYALIHFFSNKKVVA